MAPAPPRSQVTPRTVWTVGLNLLALAALVLTLHAARTVLGWALVALFLALAAHPAVAWLERHRVPRGLAVALVLLAALGLVAATLFTLVPMLVDQGQQLVAAGPELLERLRHTRAVQWGEEHFHLLERAQAELRSRAPRAAGRAVGLATGALEGLAALVSVVVLTLFMLLFGPALYGRALAWVPPQRRAHTRALLGRMRHAVGGYVAGTCVVAMVAGAVTTVALLLLGVPYYLPLGLSMVLLSIVPFVGSLLGGILVVGTTFATAGTHAGLISAGVFLGYQQVENHLLQPLVQRHTLHMNPLVTALVMLVGTALAGVLGTLLALPVAGAVQVLLQDALARREARWRQAGVQGRLEAAAREREATGPPEVAGVRDAGARPPGAALPAAGAEHGPH
ncbi:AI-2E family transporter [Aggregicoccus sp. 17bor-14]|uniref:AI-2E family transporter n=1 Tax=Myxococcaceae TaxID=31 RepID=UPI00129CD419|nr:MULTISPECIES: AI-2E family transporter [Myxococcaceae]MBF5046490.1 AI-2E family transporter [Simulacricoccus sp. 17bor-14]MRI92207.1 AI-2E family transporter [Aggregicoccus sp. 17bor-14]